MKNHPLLFGGTVLTALLAFTGQAAAAPPTLLESVSYSGCGWGAATGLKVCASADIFYYDDGTLVLNVWNNNVAGPVGDETAYDDPDGGWHTIFAIAMAHDEGGWIPTSTGLVSVDYVTFGGATPLSNWQDGANSLQAHVPAVGSNTKSGHQEGIVGCTDPGPTTADHKSTCYDAVNSFQPFVAFTFGNVDLKGNPLSDFDFLWHSAQIGNDLEDSAKGVIPEPATVVLLGFGLLGVGVAARRRRNGIDME